MGRPLVRNVVNTRGLHLYPVLCPTGKGYDRRLHECAPLVTKSMTVPRDQPLHLVSPVPYRSSGATSLFQYVILLCFMSCYGSGDFTGGSGGSSLFGGGLGGLRTPGL